MDQKQYWRDKHDRVGLSRNTAEAVAYEQAGYREIRADSTIPAYTYSIGSPGNRVDPRTWDRRADTGIPATRRAEFCTVCGDWQPQSGGCRCARNRAKAPRRLTPEITTRPGRYITTHARDGREIHRTAPRIDVTCSPALKRYFRLNGVAGIADTVDAYVEYVRAGYARVTHHIARGMAKAPDGTHTYTVGGPAHPCTREDFGRVLWGRKCIADTQTKCTNPE